MKESEEKLRDLWNMIRQSNICIMKVPEGKRQREKGPENIFKEKMFEQTWGQKWTSRSKKLPNTLTMVATKKSTLRHNQIVRGQRQRENFEGNKKQLGVYKRTHVRLFVEFSTAALQA